MAQEIKPFKIHISDSELDLLGKKLELARLPENFSDSQWGEEDEGGVTFDLMRDTLEHWRTAYDWRAVEARLNEMPQFKTVVEVDGFDPIDVHFVHAKAPSSSTGPAPTPLLFLHGWPGSFMEVQGMLPRLLEAGFDVVAPSLVGYGFSGYPRQANFKVHHQAQILHVVMVRLGYGSYCVQGGDWGSFVARCIAAEYSSHVRALHLNLILAAGVATADPEDKQFTAAERTALTRTRWFRTTNTAYQQVHATKPRTIGYALHDSPVGMLAWMMDKILIWSDTKAKPWTPDELITWTLMHYFPGPTTAMVMYRENTQETVKKYWESRGRNYVGVPVGVSHFPNEVVMSPRRFAEEENNIVFWREHDKGGHFAAYERPDEMATDIIDFFSAYRGQ